MNEGRKILLLLLGRNAMPKTRKIGTDVSLCVNLLEIILFAFSLLIMITPYFQSILHLIVFQVIIPPSHKMITAGGAQSAMP